MKYFFRIIFLSLMMAAVLFGCAPVQPKVPDAMENSFREMIAIKKMNEYFQIYPILSGKKDFKLGSDIEVSFQNLSEEEIIFPENYGVRLLIIRDNNWIEINNNNSYYGDEPSLLPKSQQKIGGRLITWVRPVLPSGIESEEHKEILRIVIVGELMTNGKKTGILTGAYTDIFVEP